MACALARRDASTSTAAAGPAVPAPRERDRAERGRERRAVRQRLDAQRLPQHRQREDVQVAGQLLHDPRRPEALRRRDHPLLLPARALPQPAQLQRRRTSTTRAARCGASTPRSTRRGAGDRARSTGREPHAAAFREAMNDDFNTPIAVAVLFELAAEVNRRPSRGRRGCSRRWAAMLGMLQQAPRAFLQAGNGVDEAASPSASRSGRRQEGAATSRAPTRIREEPGRRRASSSRTRRRHHLGEGLSLGNATSAALQPRPAAPPTTGTTPAVTCRKPRPGDEEADPRVRRRPARESAATPSPRWPGRSSASRSPSRQRSRSGTASPP